MHKTGEFDVPEIYTPFDVMQDELPDIHALSSDFKYLLEDFSYAPNRPKVAIEYAEHLKSRFKPGEYSIQAPEYAEEQILSRIYLDAMLLTARRAVYQPLVKNSSVTRFPETLGYLHKLIEAKIDLQTEISDYISLNPDKDSLTVFANLKQLMHHSRRVLFGDEVTDERAKKDSETQLLAILAEYKVLTSVQEKWPNSTLGTAENDANGTDVIVPSSANSSWAALLQVKSNVNSSDLIIISKQLRVPIIRVPMNPNLHNPLRLSDKHSAQLVRFVTATHCGKQPIATGALQTGVDRVQLAA